MNLMKYFRISVRNGLALVLFCLTTSAFSQISVSPTSLYIHSNTKIGTLYILNGSEQPPGGIHQRTLWVSRIGRGRKYDDGV